MKVKTETGRVFTIKVGTLFNCAIQEPEWFPEPRANVFAVFCGATTEEAMMNSMASPPPKVGDRIFVDFQQDGPVGDVWCSSAIVEILSDEEPPADWGTTGFEDMGIKAVGIKAVGEAYQPEDMGSDKLEQLDEAAVTGTLDVALSQLDYLDPTVGDELRKLRDTKPLDVEAIRAFTDKYSDRAWACKGPLRRLWFTASDAMWSISRILARAGQKS
jgi:hypothetical protein